MSNRILHLDIDALCAIRDALESDMEYSTHGEPDYTDIDEMYHNYHRCRALIFVKNAIKQEQDQ